MGFIHVSDLHLGCWRDQKLDRMQIQKFNELIDFSIRSNAEFLLIAGDLFETPIPRIDIIKTVVDNFKKLKENNIPVFYIAGSHDYSPSGKTILNVLESADLCKSLEIIDDKNNLHGIEYKDYYLVGISGRSRSTEIDLFKKLNIQKKPGKKNIFVFHTSITDFFKFDGIFIADLPEGFDYYAGSHVHINKEFINEKIIIFPGCFFPHVFDELWEEVGYYYYVDLEKKDFKKIKTLEKVIEKIFLEGTFTSEQLNKLLLEEISKRNLNEKIVLIKIKGVLKKGSKLSDINFKQILEFAQSKNAYLVLRNTTSLAKEEFETIYVEKRNEEEIIRDLLKENLSKSCINLTEEEHLRMLKDLFEILSSKKEQDITTQQFETNLILNFEDYIKKKFGI
ncbi:MAG: DNA repair exonuclease [Candidatus Woesearchaeota archaeon]